MGEERPFYTFLDQFQTYFALLLFFGLTIFTFAFAFPRSNTVVEQDSLSRGEQIYADNCATCHGINGKARACYGLTDRVIECTGSLLHYSDLLCDDVSYRMSIREWQGSKRDFIKSAIMFGRPNSDMEAWSERFGGTLTDAQIEDTTNFILNWATEELCSLPYDDHGSYYWPETFAELSNFRVSMRRGADIYEAYGCKACHGELDEPKSNKVGPHLGNIREVGATRVAGLNATEYIYQSILDPQAFVVPDCPTGPCASPSAMPGNFSARLAQNPSDLIDLIDYLLAN